MIPVFLQVLPLLSGVMFAVDQIPVKWQWILSFNPMTSVIAGWRWAVLDASQPNLGQVAVGVAVACVLFVVGLATFRVVGADASRTRSDVGRDRGRGALEEVPPRRVPGGVRHVARDARARRRSGSRGQEHHRAGDGALGAPGRLVRGARGAGAGRHRTQRRREVDAAEGPHADRGADRGPRRDPRAGRQPARGRHGLQPGAHGPREHLPQRRDPRDEAPGDRAALRRHRRVLRGREVHRHAGQALLERHVRPPRLRGRGAPRAGDPVRGRGARRRRRRVPGALPRADGGLRQLRADGRSSSPTTCRPSPSSATARSCSTADASFERAERGDRRALPADGGRRRLEPHVVGGRGAG